MEQESSGDKNAGTSESPAKVTFGPEQIVELNQDLPGASITLFLPPNYDKRLMPVKADHLRNWWEEDSKTRMHARFCLPITMASGLGFYILSPATFTVEWDGNQENDAEVTIIDASSHAIIDNHSAFGSFTVQSSFIPRTKNIGDFVFIKGIANQIRKPYSVMEGMIESWWSPSEFGIVCLINQPGKFTVKKGEPLAQMFVVNSQQAEYSLGARDGYPPMWPEWKVKQEQPERNLDYFRGLLPNGTPVCPHFKAWSEATVQSDIEKDLSSEDCLAAAAEAMRTNNHEEALRQYKHVIQLAETRNEVSEELIETIFAFALVLKNEGKSDSSTKLLLKCIALNQGYFNSSIKSTAAILETIAQLYQALGDANSATTYFEKSLSHKRAKGADPLRLAYTLTELGHLYDRDNKSVQASALWQEAHNIYASQLSPDDERLIHLKIVLASAFTEQQNFEEAEQMYQEVIDSHARTCGADSMEVAQIYNDLAFHYKMRKQFEQAEKCFQKCLANKESQLGADDLQVSDVCVELSWIFRDSDQSEKALPQLQRALAIRSKLFPADSETVRNTHQLIGYVYEQLGKRDLADQAFRLGKAK
jgi:tetratricopeptide (TPR) repeat protein